MGHVIKLGKLEIADHIADAVRDLKTPQMVTKLYSLLGLCNVFRRFVPDFSRIAASLTKRLMKNQPTNLGELVTEESDALATLKEKLISPLILAFLRLEGQFTINTNVCEKKFDAC